MYDTLNISITADKAPNTDFLGQVPLYLADIGEHAFAGGKTAFTGKCGGFSVSVTENRVKIGQASLCKFWHGNNFATLSREQTRQAIEQLSDTLHLPLPLATVQRVDIAQNLVLQYPTKAYLHHFGELAHYQRLPQPNGLYYQNGKRQLVFYDKLREQKAKRHPVPDEWQGANVLRFEMRFAKRLPAEFNRREVTASTLYDELFFDERLQAWAEAYQAIKKINVIHTNFEKMNSKKELYLAGVATLVEAQGGELLFCEQIQQAQHRGEITSKQAFDLKKAVKEACQSEICTTQSPLILELDRAVENGVKLNSLY